MSQTIYYFVDQVPQDSIKGGNNNDKNQANHFLLIIIASTGCKHKQNPVSIETKSKLTSLKEWLTASQSRICFSSVSKVAISLEQFLQVNIPDTTPTTVKLSPFKHRNINIEKKLAYIPSYSHLLTHRSNVSNKIRGMILVALKEETF